MATVTAEITETNVRTESAKKTRVRKPKDIPGITRPMSYEEYLAGPEEMARYDIIDGWKIYRKYGAKGLPNPTREHQRTQGNLYTEFRAFEKTVRVGQVIQPPCDVLVRTTGAPRTRQPDLLFISSARLAQNPPPDDPAPLSPAPELVVEILSPSDTRRVQTAKIADYISVGVHECWLVSMEAETVEVLSLTSGQAETIAVYGRGQTVASTAFLGLTVAVDTIFAE